MEEQQDFDQQEFDAEEQDANSEALRFDILLADTKRKVRKPAIALIVFAAISIIMTTIVLSMHVFVVASGALERMRPTTNTINEQELWIQVIGTIVLLSANIAVLMGAVRMLLLASRRSAMIACIIAAIPFLPFAIWGLIVLNDARVIAAFEEQGRRNRRGLYR